MDVNSSLIKFFSF